MSARDRILGRVRATCGHRSPHPGRFAPRPRDASWDAFGAALGAASGELVGPVPRSELREAVRARVEVAPGRVVVTATARELLGADLWEAAPQAGRPHAFADVAVAIVAGAMAVAENGAVGVSEAEVPERALLFLCERLVLLVDARAVAPDLHAAARALTDAAKCRSFTWIAGPSKTADIEQALVVGAHGPRACVVVAHRSPGVLPG